MTFLRTSRLAGFWIANGLLSACGRQVADTRSPAPPVAPAPAAPLPSAEARATPQPVPQPFPEPESIGPRSFRVLGPFPIPGAADKGHPGLDRDYLRTVGGEAKARFDSSTTVASEGKTLTIRDAMLNGRGALDLGKLYGVDTDSKVAYAYAEWTVDKPTRALALFGSDDAAAVWLNGRLSHRIAADRPLNPDNDRFELSLAAGTNRLLVKVDNAAGGWGFALRLFDDEGQRRLLLLDARRHLDRADPRPVSGEYLLDQSLPDIGWGDASAAALVFGKAPPPVRWFGPDLNPAEAADQQGQYTALIEAATLDGCTYRRMLTFAKLPRQPIPWFPSPPGSEMPAIKVPWPLDLNEAQRSELSRYFWLGASQTLRRGETSAIAALAMTNLADHPPLKGDPLWLRSGFIQAAEHQLRLRRKLEGRAARALAPPERLPSPSPELKTGSEAEAHVLPGTVQKLRAIARGWAKADANSFVVLVARRGVVFMHEGFNGFGKDSLFYPASIAKTIGALAFARAVDQGLLQFDDPVSSVLPDWKDERTAKVTFRHCFYHVTGLTEHRSHGGLFNAFLDNALFVQDAAFVHPGTRYHYNGDGFNLAGKALELVTGQSIWRLLYENVERPFAEPVIQLDLGAGDNFTAMYLAKVGQMILQDGRYGGYGFFKPGFLRKLRPERIADYAPDLDDKEIEGSIGLDWMTDPPGSREHGSLGANVLGHGASSGTTWRIDLDHQLVVVVGRSTFKDGSVLEEWVTRFVRTLAASLG